MRVSRRARYMRLTVHPGGALVVTTPVRLPSGFVEKFLIAKAEWILRAIQRLSSYTPQVRRRNSKAEYAKYKNTALSLVQSRLAYFNQTYRFAVGNIRIRNQKTRWGSCSKKGNLNFNYKIVLLPAPVADYVIVHELCHRGEFNHSKKFWGLVAQSVPNYVELRKELKRGKL